MELPSLHEEDRFALQVTGGVHVVLVIIFLVYTFNIQTTARPSFIEVEFGELQSGMPAEYAEEQNEEVATRPDPSETEPENPDPEQQEPVEEQQETTEETVKPVDAPDETEEVQDEEVVTTPEADKVDPEEQTAEQETQEEVTVPPKTEEDEVQQEGAETSGDEQGNTGELDADQGTGNEQQKSAPYELQWEGDIDRAPMVQPLPENTTGSEATITIRFEVKPDGTLGQIIPLKKMNPELEREVMQTLRSWRFSRLPSSVPQRSQWGTITFRFVVE
jgi:TonB family protein